MWIYLERKWKQSSVSRKNASQHHFGPTWVYAKNCIIAAMWFLIFNNISNHLFVTHIDDRANREYYIWNANVSQRPMHIPYLLFKCTQVTNTTKQQYPLTKRILKKHKQWSNHSEQQKRNLIIIVVIRTNTVITKVNHLCSETLIVNVICKHVNLIINITWFYPLLLLLFLLLSLSSSA